MPPSSAAVNPPGSSFSVRAGSSGENRVRQSANSALNTTTTVLPAFVDRTSEMS